jgi:hypothetical protein
MARTYREVAIEDMLRTVEEAVSRVIDWWGDLPPPMNEAVEQFHAQLGAAIDSVEFVRRGWRSWGCDPLPRSRLAGPAPLPPDGADGGLGTHPSNDSSPVATTGAS